MAEPADKSGVFIEVEVDGAAGADRAVAAKLAEVCPVDIFATDDHDGTLRIVDQNLDECVLCELCLEAAPPGGVKVHKLYDGTVLRR